MIKENSRPSVENVSKEISSAKKVKQQLLELADFSNSIKSKTFEKLEDILKPGYKDDEDMKESEYSTYPTYFEELRKIAHQIGSDLADINEYLDRVDL